MTDTKTPEVRTVEADHAGTVRAWNPRQCWIPAWSHGPHGRFLSSLEKRKVNVNRYTGEEEKRKIPNPRCGPCDHAGIQHPCGFAARTVPAPCHLTMRTFARLPQVGVNKDATRGTP